MKIYQVLHYYDVDGGFGDAISEVDTVGPLFSSREDAEKFVKKYSAPHVYDEPYAPLRCGYLEIEERELVDKHEPYHVDEKSFWWLRED